MSTKAIHEGLTLRDIALAWPASIREMEALGLDYCCGGDATLADASSARGLESGEVIRRLESRAALDVAVVENVDWREASMSELADHIEKTHHAFVRQALGRLAELLPRLVRAHGDDRPELRELEQVVGAFAEDMEDHMVREERVVFPWLRRLERPTEIQGGPPWSVRRPISCMIHDHDDAAEALRTMRRLTSDYSTPPCACGSFQEAWGLLKSLESDTHVHIHKENNILFPAGIAAEARRERTTRNAGCRTPRSCHGFTLIELLVVIAIISVLMAVLLPALGRARGSARAVACLSNTRQIAVAMTMYADADDNGYFPTARMPSMPMGGNPAAPFQMSWIYLLSPYLGVDRPLPANPSEAEVAAFLDAMQVCRCPEDHSHNWESQMMPRCASYGINAYLTPNHPPYWGIRAAQVRNPALCVLAAELAEDMTADHFMPMYWGDPPAVPHPMMQARQWDMALSRPKVIQHTRHAAERANYVFTDGHAAAHPFQDSWEQVRGQSPERNWYDPR